MINFVIAFDNQNSELGQYFEDCKNDIVSILDEQSYLVKSSSQIASNRCNLAYIDISIPQINSNPFVFIAYTHGIEDCLRCNGASFVSIDNSHHFKNSLFYSTACFIGRKLAPKLINNGCKTFIGFNDESKVLFENPVYKKAFIDSDNFAIKMFITSDVTIGQAFEAMKNHYSNKIYRAVELGEDPIFIGILEANKEALICLGDKNLKKEDLFIY